MQYVCNVYIYIHIIFICQFPASPTSSPPPQRRSHRCEAPASGRASFPSRDMAFSVGENGGKVVIWLVVEPPL